MTIIKGTTKKGANMIKSARNYEGYMLEEVYSSHSYAKRKAWEECHKLCMEENGRNFHISSFNTFGFSVAWEVYNGVRIETPKSSYLILFPEYC